MRKTVMFKKTKSLNLAAIFNNFRAIITNKCNQFLWFYFEIKESKI